jgi:hypothetical protein
MPIAFAAALAKDDGAAAACDEAIVRTIGRGYTGMLHGLDAIVTMPFGAHAQWASMACAGWLGVVTFMLARRFVRGLAPRTRGAQPREPRLGDQSWLGLTIALAGAALATLTFPAQREATLAFGSALGAVLVLAPIVLASSGAAQGVVFAALGLAITYDAPVACAAAASVGALVLLRVWRPRALAATWLLTGLVPVVWMVWRRSVSPESSLDAAALAGLLGEGALRVPRSAALAIARTELGVVALSFSAIGAVTLLRSRLARPLAGAALVVVVCGAVSTVIGAPAGPVRYGSTLLAALAAASAFAACGMMTLASAVARAKVPFARASATMIVLLELAIPVRVADDTSLAEAKLPHDATRRWNAWVFGDLPHGAVLLVPSAHVLLRARSAAAVGALRPDVIVVPTFGFGSRRTSRELGREPLLGPIVRDLALYGAPEELSLSQLAAVRPVLVSFDIRWDKLFARHLVEHGAFDRYFVEPRGAIERLKSFTPIDEPTMRLFASDPPLFDATHDMLRARAAAATATGEREYADAAIAELRRIAPSDRIAIELARRAASARGAVEVRDLANRSFD